MDTGVGGWGQRSPVLQKQELSPEQIGGPRVKRGCVRGAQPEPSRPPTGELHNRAGREDGARNWGPLFAHLSRGPQSLRESGRRLRQDRLDSRAFGFRRWRSHQPQKQTHRHHNKGGDAAAAPE